MEGFYLHFYQINVCYPPLWLAQAGLGGLTRGLFPGTKGRGLGMVR